MNSGVRSNRLMRVALVIGLASLGLPLQGCRTGAADIEHWATTVNGPKKLVAVLTHDKYPTELRSEAGLALALMKPRGGRRVGIEMLTEALQQVAPGDRAPIIALMVPKLVTGMAAPIEPSPDPQHAAVDPSIAPKDAAFALLTRADGSLMSDEKLKEDLRAALAAWAAAFFPERLDDTSQMFGMEQVLRTLGAQGVRALPEKIVPGGRKLDRLAELIADLGDEPTKLLASTKLVEIAKQTDSEAWLKAQRAIVEEQNKLAGYKDMTADRVDKQLDAYQAEELTRLFVSMKKLGGEPVVDYLLAYGAQKIPAEDKRELGKRAGLALAALEGRIDRKNPKQVEAILAVATAADTPDVVRDQALRRVGELPRELVVERLYGLFGSDNWKIRWVAGELLLKLSDTSQLDEFMQHIGKISDMAMTEPLRYGAVLSAMKPTKGEPAQLIQAYLASGPVPARLIAFGYYFEHGTAADLPKIEPFTADRTKTPACRKDAKDCEWSCSVTTNGKAESKDITTVGEFVSYCVKPAMEKRPASAEKK